VAYQRADLLRQALDAVAAQTRRPDAVLVVDNASTDGSADVARSHPVAPDVVALDRNTGGAGGFTVGLATAIVGQAASLVWLMDDDTIPRPTALAELLKARATYDGRVVALASRVVWTDGRDHPMNTPRRRPGASSRASASARAAGAYPVRSMSFVSMLVDAAAVRAAGLPIADYFLWNDDFEFSARLLRHGVGLYVPSSVVEHRTRLFGSTDVDPGPRFFNEVRNKIWVLTRSPALSPAERVLYAGATLRRWMRTLRGSTDRQTLLRAGQRGLAEGVGRRPRLNVDVLDGLGTATAAVAALESRPVAAPQPSPSGSGPEPFSVLLPVYAGDRAEHLDRAFRSVTRDQTLPPDQVVVVRDGPVRGEVERLLATLAETTDVPLTLVQLATNRGLAEALQAGLAACKHDIVARADADDISLPDRFAVQVRLVSDGYDLVGSAITEFATDEHVRGVTRVPPLTQAAIARYARFHDPFNHPSVVYRRQAVEAASGYEHLALLEDYLLFARMIALGARVANVPDSLVLYRVGAGAYARRGGLALLRSEILLQRRLRAERFTSRSQFARNVVVRGGYRLAPEQLRRVSYRAIILARRDKRQQ
jgi:GT2 family glycosyltransferase